MSDANVDRRGSAEPAGAETGTLRRTVARNHYLWLTSGPIAGCLVGWLSGIASYTIAGSAIQYAIAVMVALIFMVPGLLLSRSRQPADTAPATGGERPLLDALGRAGGSITPIEAAVETRLTVDEAEGTLSRLAAGGHLSVQSRDGALYYTMPGKRLPEPGEKV